jgi:hypothetical protein
MKKINSLLINLCLLSFSMLISYFILIFADWYISHKQKISVNNNVKYLESKKLIEKREAEEDKFQIAKAVADGYKPALYPSLMDELDLDFPLIAGIPYTKTYYCNEGYGLVKYNSDRFGFRNDDKNWDQKKKLIVIGDSYVHGACVLSENTLVKQLSKINNNVVLNLGYGGNTPSHYRVYGELFIPKLLPSKVFLVFYANDNNRGTSVLEKIYLNQKKKLFSSDDIKLFDTNLFVKEGMKAINILKKKKNVLNKDFGYYLNKILDITNRHAKLPMITQTFIGSKKLDIKTHQSISSINKMCKIYSCNLTIVYIPNSIFFQPDHRADSYAELIRELTNKLNLKFVDGRKFINQSKDSKDYAIKGSHLSPLGYRKIAEAMFLSGE